MLNIRHEVLLIQQLPLAVWKRVMKPEKGLQHSKQPVAFQYKNIFTAMIFSLLS